MTQMNKDPRPNVPRQPGKKGPETLDFAKQRKKNRLRSKLARAARKKNRG